MTINDKINNKINIGVVGARGYSGLELVRLLLKHPRVQVKGCFGNQANAVYLSDYLMHPNASGIQILPEEKLWDRIKNFNVVFLATPAHVSCKLAPKILDQNIHVIDLSGAFRFQNGSSEAIQAQYRKWYGFEHPYVEYTKKAKYGLIPWLEKKSEFSNTSELIANPGCYATAVLMALIPLLKNAVIDPETIAIDAKSGTSGAGRKPSENLLFTEVEGECVPYKIGCHQHFPEICEFVQTYTHTKIDPHLSTHLLSTRRGIICGIYAKQNPKFNFDLTNESLRTLYLESYLNYPLVRIESIESSENRLSPYSLYLRSVVGTPRTHIGFKIEKNKIYVFSLIDNLLKGAASQAIENLNALYQFDSLMGLDHLEEVL